MTDDSDTRVDKNYFDAYKELVDRAQKEIAGVRSVYIWLATIIGVIVAAGIGFNYKSAFDYRKEAREEVDEYKATVEKRLNTELGEKAISLLIDDRIKSIIDKRADDLINKSIDARVKPLMSASESKLHEIEEAWEHSSKRNMISNWADKAIAETSRSAYDEIVKVEESNKEGSDLYIAAQSAEARVIAFWYSMRRQTKNLPIKNPDGTPLDTNTVRTDALTKLLLTDSRWDVRMEAARLLGQRREEQVLHAYIDTFRKEQNLEVIRETLRSYSGLTGKDYNSFGYKKALEEWDNDRASIIKTIKP